MNMKMFLSVLAAGAFCVVNPAQAQQSKTSNTTGDRGATNTSSAKAGKQTATTSKKAADRGLNAGSTASGPQQKIDVVIGSTISPSKVDLAPGRFLVNVKNVSDKQHKIVFQGGAAEKIELNLRLNASGTMEGSLTPGSYRITCETSGHNESSTKITVK